LDSLVKRINAKVLIDLSASICTVDVRTPMEFEQGHIPGAVNLPLFNNEERAEVGTLYKKRGRETAILRGLEIAGPKLSGFFKKGIKYAGKEKSLLVHCWRGGMRSENMAWLFSKAGIKCSVLEGGYKSYRNHVLSYLSEARKAIVLGGLTGSGKTGILLQLRESGEMVIDLEGIANHRGSAFGSLGMSGQPTSEHFANLLFDEIRRTDPKKRLFLEDESMNIGSVFLPDSIHKLIRESQVIAVIQDVKTRIPQLLKDYGDFPKKDLKAAVSKIQKRLGGERAREAIVSIDEGKLEKAIEIVLYYYDKTYRYGLERREKDSIHFLETDSNDPVVNARMVLEMVKNLKM